MDGVTVKVLSPLPAELEAFALNSWLQGHERLVTARPHMALDRSGFYRLYRPELLRLLRTSRVALATPTEDPDCFLGWACGVPDVLHYVYVKYASRRFGLAAELVAAVAEQPKIYTFAPCGRRGELRDDLTAVAQRRGWKHREHRFGWRYNADAVARLTQQEPAAP